MNRALAPKPVIPVHPVMVSQLTSLAILGVDERRFLEIVVPKCARVTDVGRLRLVPIEDAVRALTSAARERDAAAPAPPSNDASNEGVLDFESPDAVLRALGRRRIAGSAR